MIADRLKFFLRAIGFVGLTVVVENYALDPLFHALARWLGLGAGLTAESVGLNELENFLVALICTGAFATMTN